MALEKVITHEPPCKVHGNTYRANVEKIFGERRFPKIAETGRFDTPRTPQPEDPPPLFEDETSGLFGLTPEQEDALEHLRTDPAYRVSAGLDAPTFTTDQP